MNLVTLDLETFFDGDYSLSRLTTEEYVRDPRFKAHLVGLKLGAAPARVYPSDALRHDTALRTAIESSAVIVHHAHFDGLILNHHFGLRPKFWIDTLSMARAMVRDPAVGGSLGKLLAHFGLAGKILNYADFKGCRELPPALYREVAVGCVQDVEQTHKLYEILRPYVPDDEMTVIDQVIRMFTEACLRLDRPRLEKFLNAEKRRKAEAIIAAGEAMGLPCPLLGGGREGEVLAHLGRVEIELQSAAKFKLALEGLGYLCPMKHSERQDCDIPALARNDDGMKALAEHADPRVQALAAARLGVKSTIDETRAQRLLDTDSRGPLPVYLAYGAAKTLRFGGGDKTNWQNFRRGGEIRKSILAPEGYKLVIVDLSQIEYRLLLWLVGQLDKLAALAAGEDLYCAFASTLYGEEVTKEDKPRRGTGKQGTLQCLAKGTLTVTSNGIKPIEEVTEGDRLWDGVEWVQHQGLVAKGERSVTEVAGFRLTPDHSVLCGAGSWRPAAMLHDERFLFRALARGSESLSSLAIALGRAAGSKASLCDALAAHFRIGWISTTLPADVPHAAIAVQRRLRRTGLKNIGGMQTSSQTPARGSASFPVFLRALIAAITLRMPVTIGMEGGAYACFGAGISEHFWPMSLHFQDGMTRCWSLIAQTMRKATNQTIFALSPVPSTRPTVAPSRSLAPSSCNSNANAMTYDLAFAGPRNRFTVVSSAGNALVVHNCGYGAGADSIIRTALSGAYGPPVLMSYAEGLAVRDTYRTLHPGVVAFWKWCQGTLGVLAAGGETTYKCIAIAEQQIWLPNGQSLDFAGLRWGYFDPAAVAPGEEPSYFHRTREGWSRIWGSKLTADIIQALAGVVIRQAMARIGPRYRIVLQVHDEIVCAVPDAEADAALAFCLAEMVRTPAWADAALLLAAEGLVSVEYAK